MSFENIKEEIVIDTVLRLLERNTVLPSLIWRDAVTDFRGKKDDTVSIRLPAYVKANKRALRSGTTRDRKSLHERKVDVTLSDGLFVDVALTDEHRDLDIRSLVRDVIAPGLGAIARAYEDEVATLMGGESYANSLQINEEDPYETLIDARKALNDARVPASQRFLAVGSSVEAAILKSKHLSQFDQSGSSEAFREAIIGRIAGFTAVSAQGLHPDKAYAAHKTAYALVSRAPSVPDGAPWGARRARDGFAIRVMQALDASDTSGPANVLFTDAWVGTKAVADRGHIDPDTNQFEPAEDPDESGAADHFVRAVELTLGS